MRRTDRPAGDDRLHRAGRNADFGCLQVMFPVAVGEHAWSFAGLTDVDATDLALVSVVETVVAA